MKLDLVSSELRRRQGKLWRRAHPEHPPLTIQGSLVPSRWHPGKMNFATETKPFVMKRAATMRSVKELPLSFANDGWAGYDGVPHNVPASASLCGPGAPPAAASEVKHSPPASHSRRDTYSRFGVHNEAQ